MSYGGVIEEDRVDHEIIHILPVVATVSTVSGYCGSVEIGELIN